MTDAPFLTLTPAAQARARALVAAQTPRPEALLVAVTNKGCSGLRYDVRFLERLADAPVAATRIALEGLTVVVDPGAALFLAGATMDYSETPLRSGFTFANPNEVARCGCGESFATAGTNGLPGGACSSSPDVTGADSA